MDQRTTIRASDARTATEPPGGPRLRLAVEFVLLYVAAPLAMAFLLEARLIWWALGAVTAVGLGLLAATPGFRWRSLIRRPFVPDARFLLVFAGAAAAVIVALTLWLAPGYFFAFPASRPIFWLVVMILYPVLSVIPQELVFRVLFFHRYGDLFRRRALAVTVNAAAFGLAHLFYWNWPALILTAIAGALFGYCYSANRAFVFVCLLHAVSGWLLFTVGLGGRYFFHGAPALGLY